MITGSVHTDALLAVLVVSLISLIGVFSLAYSRLASHRATILLVSLASGALLGDAFVHLIPEAFEELEAILVSSLVIAGVFVFFLLEKILHWHHHHGPHVNHTHTPECEGSDCPTPIKPIGRVVLVSDALHNLIDGMIIAASFFASPELGLITTLAVILHEIPQEVGDFGILLHAGYSKGRALFINFLSALVSVIGAIIVFVVEARSEQFIAYMLPITAGGFIYLALADIVPELHKSNKAKSSVTQIAMMLIGIGLMYALIPLEQIEFFGHVGHSH